MKVYYFVPALANMVFFTKPACGKLHVRHHARATTLCGRPASGEIIPEASESQMCAQCLHTMRDRYSGRFSYREVEEPAQQEEKRVVGTKCAFCKKEERSRLWQPALKPHLYLPGSHVRGFAAIAIGASCISHMDAGEALSFTYRKKEYQAKNWFVKQEIVR